MGVPRWYITMLLCWLGVKWVLGSGLTRTRSSGFRQICEIQVGGKTSKATSAQGVFRGHFSSLERPRYYFHVSPTPRASRGALILASVIRVWRVEPHRAAPEWEENDPIDRLGLCSRRCRL